MYFTVNSFYVGLITGTVVGISLTLYAIKNRVFRNKLSSVDDNSGHGDVQQNAEEYKMALLVRHDLKMGKGKVAAQCAVVSVIAYNKNKLKGLPSKCARIVLRAPDLKTIECIHKQCKLFDIPTATLKENNQVTILAIGPAYEDTINAQVHSLKLY